MRYETDDAVRLAPVKEDNNAMRKIDRRYVVVSKFGDYNTHLLVKSILQEVILKMPNFIPKQYKKDPITIRINFDKLEKIDNLAANYNLSRSEFINQCIDFALEHMSSSEKNK